MSSFDALQECAKRKCKWVGTYEHMVLVKRKNDPFDISDYTCPICGSKEFYVLDSKESSSR